MVQSNSGLEIPINKASKRVFPIENTNLAKVLNDPKFRNSFHSNLKKYNPFLVFFYRIGLLPLFGMSKTVMLLITKGNKSGKTRYTPIGYFKIGGVIHLFSAWGKNTGWYKNMQTNPDEVCIQIGLKKMQVSVKILDDNEEIQHTLEKFISESPSIAGYLFGWDPTSDTIINADFSQIIQKVLILRFSEK